MWFVILAWRKSTTLQKNSHAYFQFVFVHNFSKLRYQHNSSDREYNQTAICRLKLGKHRKNCECCPLSPLRHKTILQTCDIWDTDYNSENWEPEFMTIFVTSQSRVTLDSIRNSCDVYLSQRVLLFSHLIPGETYLKLFPVPALTLSGVYCLIHFYKRYIPNSFTQQNCRPQLRSHC